MTQSQHIIIFVTAKDKKEAKKIAKGLLEARLIACANIVSGVESMFWWEGKIDSASENLLVLKTQAKNFSKCEEKILTLHSYKTPEIISLPISAGHSKYLQWITDETV